MTTQPEPLPLERYAEISADIDAGAQRDTTLERADVAPETWASAQAYWLKRMADEAARNRFATTTRYQALFQARRRVALARAARPAPPAPTPPPVAELRAAVAAIEAPIGAAAPVGLAAPSPPPVPGTPHRASPPPLPSAPQRPPFASPTPPAAAPLSSGTNASPPASPERAPAMPSYARSAATDPYAPTAPPPVPVSAYAPTAPPPVPVSAYAPTAPPPVPPPGPARPRAPATMAASIATLQPATPFVPARADAIEDPVTAAPETAPAPAQPEARPVKQDLGSTMMGAAVDLLRPAMPFEARAAAAPARPRPTRDDSALPFGAGPRVAPPEAPAASIELSALEQTAPPTKAPAMPALPFASAQRSPTAAAQPIEASPAQPTHAGLPNAPASSAGAVGAAAATTRFPINTFASLTAEIAENPAQIATIRERYQLSEGDHLEESRRWEEAFSRNAELRQRYLGIVQRYRGYLQQRRG